MQKILLLLVVLFSFSFLYSDASTEDTLSILNEDDCYNTGNCHYRFTFATDYYSFSPMVSNLYEIVVNVLDSENVWHNYYKTVAQCVTEGVCDAVTAQYIDFWFQHNVSGNQYIAVEIFGNGDDAYDYLYHDILIDYCYGVNCGTGGTCDGTSGYPVCSCEEGYVLRGGICEEGWFEDENLAAAIVELLQYEGYDVETESDIDPEMLEDIETLALRGRNISSLAGIELFSSLTVLDISENNISDLSPLSNCEELRILNMSSNPANDLNPLSNLPLASLDVSYSGVYNFNPLFSIATLSELIIADSENDKHGMIRPDDIVVSSWLDNLNLLDCNELIPIYGSVDNTYHIGLVGVSGGCPQHGSCVEGRCVCDEGYVYSDNKCFDPYDCGSGYHYDAGSGTCESDTLTYFCGDLPENAMIVSINKLHWNGSEYIVPAGHTTELCRAGDPECTDSICRWGCLQGYMWVKDDICVPNNESRFIPSSTFNQLLLPNISRQDAILEPVPGVPSFAPVMKAELYYNAGNHLKSGWHLDLPRVELNINDVGYLFHWYEWDQKTVYIYMPWGKEEYSIAAEKKCFDADNDPLICITSDDLSNADHVEITYYPAPGQNLFSYVVLKTTGAACKSGHGTSGKVFENVDSFIGKDRWTVTRYGDDGSVTEFYRGAILTTSIDPVPPDPIPVPRDIVNGLFYTSRPAEYSFMDYIPISKHTTRDKKVTSFKYNWQRVKNHAGKFSHYSIASVDIVDPLKRVIKIESDSAESGLMGKPDIGALLYKPLEGVVTISVGKGNANPFKKVAEYNFEGDFEMEATIYKDENPYRHDKYSKVPNYEKRFELESTNASNELKGETVWDFTAENNKPTGYTERKLINSDTPEYAVKTVKGTFYQSTQWKFRKPYALYLPENESERHKITTIYSDGTDKTRIVEDYFTNWLQPAKKVICKPRSNEDEDCTDNATAVTEEIKYNVQGSPIYFRNADGQVTVNLYNRPNAANTSNYTVHFYQIPGFDTYTNFDSDLNLNLNIFRFDSLHKSATLLCSALYSLNADDDEISTMLIQYAYGLDWDSGWCSNGANRRVTNYVWQKEEWEAPYDLKTVIYPDGKRRSFTYNYNVTSDGVGKVAGETITGSNNQNSLQTCYEYDSNHQLVAQGTGPAGSGCDYKKGFEFDSSGLLMTKDYSYDENNRPILENDYIYDYLGRKLVERNSAGVSTVYVYDSLDRVVFTFFGCNVDNFAFENRLYTPYNFDGDDSAGENGRGVAFDYNSGEFPYARYINLNTCEYYRKYKYDEMSNLTETYFFEYWGINQNNQIEPLDQPIIIKQKTEYDMLGRAVKSCQSDATVVNPEKRCIETEHDAFGNIVKKTENSEERIITYDHRNRPLTVTVDGLLTEQYSYNNAAANGYFGYDTIRNKYENIEPLKTYKDRWGRAAKSIDPFGNETETTYESSYSDNITSQTTTSSGTKTGETTWTYDDLGRKSTETRKQFIPGSESTTNVNHVTYWDYDSIGNVEYVVSSDDTAQNYVYDSLNRLKEVYSYRRIVENNDPRWDEDSFVENFYDAQGRLFRTETTRNSQTITEDYGFDTFGCIVSVKTTDPSNSSRYRVKFYNTGGQVIWEADEESDADPRNYGDLGLGNVEIGNQKYYTYNAFGDLEKTVYVMTNSGRGLGSPDINPWLNDSQITTNFTYDIFGRITSRTNDRSGVTAYSYYPNNTTGSHRRNKLRSIQITPAPTNNDTGYQDSDSVAQTYTYTYDEYGDEASVEYTEGNSYSMEVAFTRDAYGRIISKTSDGSVPVTQTFTYNMRNLLETATDTVGNAAATSVIRYYDSFGNPYSESVTANNVTKTVSRRMTDAKTYQFTYPDGKTLRKTATGNNLDLIEYNNSEIASYSRANGVLTALTKGRNLIETFSYNNWNMLDNHTISNANADVYDMSYNYSRGWHLIEKADGIKNTSDKYSYDSYYRLKEVKYDFANNTAARTDSFYQDGVHNIEQSTENGTTFAWGVDKLNRLRDKKVGNNTEVAYEYDERNNMISEDRSGTTNDRTYIYDDLNRLIEVKDGSQNTIATYTYDAFNRRITKTVGTTTERYSYDDWSIVEILTNSDLYTNIIDSGTDRHIAIELIENNASTLYYFITDERGNVTALTDANGNILERYRYRVYGDFEILDAQFTPKNCNNQTCYATNLHNFLWGGSLYEPETNLYWMRNRYYHIDMHRFINQDPIGIWGDANNLGNGFAYVAGMVVEASDPSGLDVEVIFWDPVGYGKSAFGHVSVRIDDISYSWGENGMDVSSAQNYALTNIFRDGEGFILSISENDEKELAQYLNNYAKENGKWTPINNCTQPIQSWLNEKYGKDLSSYFPSSLKTDLTDSGMVEKQSTKYEKGNKIASGSIKLEDGTTLQYEQYKTAQGLMVVKYSDGTTVLMDKYGNKIILREGEKVEELKAEDLAYPTPDGSDPSDTIQNVMMLNILAKMLKRGESEQPPFFTDTSTGPNGVIMIFRNPYYVNKDPLKTILFDGGNGSGRPMIYRNPFVPGAEYGYDSTTYEKWQQSGFIQPEVDPWE